jgi:hypothetical protein
MPRPEGQHTPAPEEIKAASAPLDWSPEETARLKALAREFAALRDKTNATPADDVRLQAIADELKEAIAEKERTSSDSRADFREAETILKENFLGPDAFEKTFGFKPDNVPALPYSTAELEKCNALNEQVVLRLATDADGNPMNIPRLQALFKEKTGQKLLYTDWDPAKQPFAAETPKLEWKRVSKDVIPGSKNKNYFDQTVILYDYLVKAGTLLNDANERTRLVAEVQRIHAKYDQDPDSNWKQAADELATIPINKTYRRKAVETLSDVGLRKGAVGDYQLPAGSYDWGNSRHSGGNFVYVGYFDAQGASVSSIRPGSSDPDLGVCSSR